MKQQILAPDDEWITYLAHMLLFANELTERVLGQSLDGSTGDLERIQAVIDAGQITADDEQSLHSLGIAFGKVLIRDSMP